MKKALPKTAAPAAKIEAPAANISMPARRRWPAAVVLGAAALTLGASLLVTLLPRAHSAGGPVSVSIANPVTAPALTRDADSPSSQPVSVTLYLGPTQTGSTTGLYNVPTGKRLVIDYVNVASTAAGDANSYSFQLSASQGGQYQYASFNLLPDGAPASAVSERVQLFADAGTYVDVFAASNGKNAGGVVLTMTGHLANLP